MRAMYPSRLWRSFLLGRDTKCPYEKFSISLTKSPWNIFPFLPLLNPRFNRVSSKVQVRWKGGMQEKPFIYQHLHPIFYVDNVCITMFHALTNFPFLSTKYIFLQLIFCVKSKQSRRERWPHRSKKTLVGNAALSVPKYLVESRFIGSKNTKCFFILPHFAIAK